MLDFSEFLKVPATYRFVKLCEYASNKLLFLLFDGSITLSKKQEETAHYIIHIMWYRGEYMGCENLAGMKFAHLLVLKRDEMKKAHIPTALSM